MSADNKRRRARDAAVGHGNLPRKLAFVIIGPHAQGDADLLELIDAFNSFGLGFGSGERGQEQARKNSDDGDDNQEFNQRKPHPEASNFLLHRQLPNTWN